MTITNEQFKLNLEQLIKERQEPMNNISAGYEATKKDESSKITNLTNIGEAHKQKYGYGSVGE